LYFPSSSSFLSIDSMVKENVIKLENHRLNVTLSLPFSCLLHTFQFKVWCLIIQAVNFFLSKKIEEQSVIKLVRNYKVAKAKNLQLWTILKGTPFNTYNLLFTSLGEMKIIIEFFSQKQNLFVAYFVFQMFSLIYLINASRHVVFVNLFFCSFLIWWFVFYIEKCLWWNIT